MMCCCQVPHSIALACKLDLTGPASALVLACALTVLHDFISWAALNHMFPSDLEQQGPAHPDRLALQDSILQQLQEAGLQQQLTAIMAALRQHLPAAASSSRGWGFLVLHLHMVCRPMLLLLDAWVPAGGP